METTTETFDNDLVEQLVEKLAEDGIIGAVATEKTKPKKERTEKQKANDAKLSDRFKTYHQTKREKQRELNEIVNDFPNAESVELNVIDKAKRKYTKKVKQVIEIVGLINVDEIEASVNGPEEAEL